MFEVCLAGTGGMLPLPDRFLTGLWVEHGGNALLIDCGEGMQIALAGHGCRIARLDTILITHLHADHIAGLPGLLLSAGNSGRRDKVRIIGVKGIIRTVENLRCIFPELPFEIEVSEAQPLFMWHDVEVRSMPVRHRVPCLCYSLTEHRPPVFNPQKAMELGIPQKYWRVLHSGGEAEIDGRIFTSADISDGERPPLKIAYMTDTVSFQGLAEFARSADLLICEGMYGDDEYIPKMKEKGHSVFSQAAQTAAAAEAKELWLTHYSPALTNPKEYTKSVRKIFPNTVVSEDGQRKTVK